MPLLNKYMAQPGVTEDGSGFIAPGAPPRPPPHCSRGAADGPQSAPVESPEWSRGGGWQLGEHGHGKKHRLAKEQSSGKAAAQAAAAG